MQPIFNLLKREEATATAGNDFSRALAKQRSSKKLSVATIARRAQVNNEEYRGWERGTGFPAAKVSRMLAAWLWENNHTRVEQLCKRGRRQRRSELTARMLRKNKISLNALNHFRRENKTWLSCVKDALADNAPHLTPAAVEMLRKELKGKRSGQQFSVNTVQNISAALQLNFTHMRNKIKIETILTAYQNKKEKYGDFLLDNAMRKALENAVVVLTRKDKRSITTLLARVPKRAAAPALPLTFSARLRHAEVNLQNAMATSTISPFTMELYYYGLSLPANNASIVKKVCKAFRLTYSQNMSEALHVEEKARKYLQKMFHSTAVRVNALPRLVLDEAVEMIMADYSQLSRIIFRQRIALQLSMRRAAQVLQLDFDDYLELEWCMYPTQLVILHEARFLSRLAKFLDTSPTALQGLTSAVTTRREERARQDRNAQPAREAQLAAEAEVEKEGRLSDETPKLAAQRILCQLAEQHITAATLQAFDKNFVTRIKETGVCTPAAAEKGKIDAAKIRFYLHGRGFPNDRDLQKICTGFAIGDIADLQHVIEIERAILEYQLAISRLGALPLPSKVKAALEQASSVKMRDYSEFSRALFKRRAKLQLSQLEAARRLGCKDSTDYRKLEWSLTPSLSRTLKKPEVLEAVAEFLQLPVDAVRKLIASGSDEQLIHRGREDTPAAAAWNIERRMREHDISIADCDKFDKAFAAHIRNSGVSVAEASDRCELDSTRIRQYIDGKGFPVDRASLEKVCHAFALDVTQMEKLVSVEKTARRYMTDTSRVGALPLPPATLAALEKAVEIVVAEYSEFALRLYRRRCELQITQREAAERLGISNSNSYRKMEQSTSPLIDRGLKKNPQTMANIADFLQMTLDELKGLFVERQQRNTQSSAYAIKVASERVMDSLQQSGLGVAELRSFEQSFAARLRASGVSLAEACRRSVFSRSKIKPCFEGQHLPTGKHELHQFCSDFSLGDYEQVKQQLDIEKEIRDYMAKTTRYGALEFPQEVKDALDQGVETIMSDYCELSRLLTQRRTELQLSMEAAATTLCIKTHEYYRKLERSSGSLPEGALRGNPETIPRMAEFLQISEERLRELIAAATADEEDEPPPVVEDKTAIALREATTEIIKQLLEKGITPECLQAFDKTFAAHLRATGIAPQRAAVRVDMEAENIEPYLRGERLPRDEHELQKICSAFGISNYTALQKVVDIEAVVNFYMQKISELGPLPFPEETKDPLNRVTQIIKSTYSEFGKLLFRKRFDLKMSLEEAAQELGIEQTQNYHELERSAMPAQSTLLHNNPAIVENLADFLELPLDQVQRLVTAQNTTVQ